MYKGSGWLKEPIVWGQNEIHLNQKTFVEGTNFFQRVPNIGEYHYFKMRHILNSYYIYSNFFGSVLCKNI